MFPTGGLPRLILVGQPKPFHGCRQSYFWKGWRKVMHSPLPWFRLYSEFATDPKIQILEFDEQRHFVMLLCLKGNGTLDADAPSLEYRNRLIAKGLGVSVVQADLIRAKLVESGLISDDWQPLKWHERQFVSDRSTDRVRKHRNGMKRFSNVPVTAKSQSQSQIQKQIKNSEPVTNWSAEEEKVRQANLAKIRQMIDPVISRFP